MAKKRNGALKIAGSIFLVIFAVAFVFVSAAADIFHIHQALAIDESIAVNNPQQQSVTQQWIRDQGKNIILNPYGNSPLSAIIYFTTDKDIAPTVVIEGKDDNSSVEFEFSAAKEHFLPIYGLYPNKDNKVLVKYDGESHEYLIKTEALPSDFVLPTDVTANKEKLGREWYFYSPAAKGYTCAYDVNGDVRWYLTQTAPWEINRLKNGHLLVGTDRIVGKPYYDNGLYEMDLLGKIYTEFSLPGGYHHDYFELENGNLLVASDDLSNNSSTVEDIVVELDRTSGEIVKTWDIKKALPSTVNTGNEDWSSEDWFHNNSIWYDEDSNSIILSGRHADGVISISYDDGSLNWIFGDKTNWPTEYEKYFFTPEGDDFEWQWSQHAAMITPEGYLFLFDNGNNKSKIESEYVAAKDGYSRGVMYELDTAKMTASQVWEYGKERGFEFYSPYISDVDYLADGHYIVHSGGISYKNGEIMNGPASTSGSDKLVTDTVELIDDEVVFEMKLPTNYYRMEKMAAYVEQDKDGFSDASLQTLGSIGETEYEEKRTGLFLNQKLKDIAELDEHEVKITNEGNRLKVAAKFKENTNVRLVLVKGLEQKYYKIRINNMVHAAMCIAIFDEGENADNDDISVARYVNAEGLSGKYKIYLEVYDDIYDTGESVKF